MNLDLDCVRRYLDEVILTEVDKVIDVCSDVGQEQSFDQPQRSEEIHQREQRLHRDRQRKASKRSTESAAEREKRLRINRERMKRRINKETVGEHTNRLRRVRSCMARRRAKNLNKSNIAGTECADRSTIDFPSERTEVPAAIIIDKEKATAATIGFNGFINSESSNERQVRYIIRSVSIDKEREFS